MSNENNHRAALPAANLESCNTCNDDLIVGHNWTPSMKKTRWYVCAPCRNKRRRDFYKIDNSRNRDQELKSRYGISLDWYNKKLDDQSGVCAICGSADSGAKRTDNFFVDHDHKTGKVRALLCHQCNTGISKFRDDPVLLYSAIKYLEDHSE